MWETSFQHASSTPLPPNVSIDTGLLLLRDFDCIVRLSPDCRGCQPIPAPPTSNGSSGANASNGAANGTSDNNITYYEVEDDLPFVPKRLWSGGVKYQADFLPTSDGCDITVHAPGGFTSTNRWRLLRGNEPAGRPSELEHEKDLDNVKSKTLLHADQTSSGWYVQIVSDATVNRAFANFVKGALRNSHQQLQHAFIEKLKGASEQPAGKQRPRLGRRKSSVL